MISERFISIILLVSIVLTPAVDVRSEQFDPVLTKDFLKEATQDMDYLDDFTGHISEYLSYSDRTRYEFHMQELGELFAAYKENPASFTLNELSALIGLYLKISYDYEQDLQMFKTHRLNLARYEFIILLSLALGATAGDSIKKVRNNVIDRWRTVERDKVHESYERAHAEVNLIREEASHKEGLIQLTEAVEVKVRQAIRGGDWRGKRDLTNALRSIIRTLADERKIKFDAAEETAMIQRIDQLVKKRDEILRLRRDRKALAMGREYTFDLTEPKSWIRWFLVTFVGKKRISREAPRDAYIERIGLMFKEIEKGGFRSIVHQSKVGIYSAIEEAQLTISSGKLKPGADLSKLRLGELNDIFRNLAKRVRALDGGVTLESLQEKIAHIESEATPKLKPTKDQVIERIKILGKELDERRPPQKATPEIQAEMNALWQRVFKDQNFEKLVDDAYTTKLKGKVAPGTPLQALKPKQLRDVFCYFRDKMVLLEDGTKRLKVLKSEWPKTSLYDRLIWRGWVWLVAGGVASLSVGTYLMRNQPEAWWMGGRTWLSPESLRRDPLEIIEERVGKGYLQQMIVDYKGTVGLANLSEEELALFSAEEERTVWREGDAKEAGTVAAQLVNLGLPGESELRSIPPPEEIAGFGKMIGETFGPEPKMYGGEG